MWQTRFQQQTVDGVFHRLNLRPSWPLRTALLCGVLVIVVPLLVLMLGGLLVGAATYFILSLVAKVMSLLGIDPPGHRRDESPEVPGRENVRVIEPE